MQDRLPSSITMRCCPECSGMKSWSVHGYAYPAGDDSKWKCPMCGYLGKPKYEKYEMIIVTKQMQELWEKVQHVKRKIK